MVSTSAGAILRTVFGPGDTAHAASQAALLALVAESLAKGHRKVAARRTLMLLYRFGDAPPAYVDAMAEVLDRCKPAEAARMRRVSIEWARVCRGLPFTVRREAAPFNEQQARACA